MIEDVQGPSSGNIEQYLGMLRRRRWWLLLPAFLCWLVVWGVSWILPPSYQSKTIIQIGQPNVPEQYVMPNVTTSVQDQLAGIQVQVLSRPQLLKIINDHHLYQNSSRWFGPTDPVDQMSKDIEMDPLMAPTPKGGRPGGLVAFQILYKAPTAHLAQVVDAELADSFVRENSQAQHQASQSTTTFLGSQVDEARKRLQDQEEKVSAFKAKYLGQLPSQMQSNVQILSGMQGHLQSLEQALDHAQQQKLYLQSLVEQYRSAEATSDSSSPATPAALDKEVKQLELQLADARSKYTDNYPDVVALKEQIEKTKKLRDQTTSELSSPQKADGAKDTDSNLLSTDPQKATLIMQMQSELKSNQLQIQDYQKQIDDLQGQIKSAETRLNLTPVTEQAFQELTRGYDEAEANYSALLKRRDESQLASNLQVEQNGQYFRLIDPADAPLQPFWPNHLLISLGGLGGGIFLGIGITLMKELADVRIRQEKDLEGLVAARVLVGIPRLSTPKEVQRRKWMRLAESAGMAMLALGVVVGNVISFIKG
jgi:polysaccharide biosynthesis transport protein